MQSENNQRDAPQALNAQGQLIQQTSTERANLGLLCVDLTATNTSANQSQEQKRESP